MRCGSTDNTLRVLLETGWCLKRCQCVGATTRVEHGGEPIVAELTSHEDRQVRDAALRGIAAHDDTADALCAALGDEDAQVPTVPHNVLTGNATN